MVLNVEGKRRVVSDIQLRKLDYQYGDLIKAIKKKDLTLMEWIEKFDCNKVTIAMILRNMHLNSLASDLGMAFLFSKIPCPMGS